jgi:hypothetical protein
MSVSSLTIKKVLVTSLYFMNTKHSHQRVFLSTYQMPETTINPSTKMIYSKLMRRIRNSIYLAFNKSFF